MAIPVQAFIDELSVDHRVVVIGGLAVIGHGYSRQTQDADIWLDPKGDPQTWADIVSKVCAKFDRVLIHRLPDWVPVSGDEVAIAVEDTGVVRISGLSCPLDIFRRPNEFDETDFEAVAARARLNSDGTLLPDPLDLIQSKLETGRDKDRYDIFYLESVIRSDYKLRLPSATLSEAEAMLARYSECEVLLEALKNPSPKVHELAMTHLREFAAAGDPFSREALERMEGV